MWHHAESISSRPAVCTVTHVIGKRVLAHRKHAHHRYADIDGMRNPARRPARSFYPLLPGERSREFCITFTLPGCCTHHATPFFFAALWWWNYDIICSVAREVLMIESTSTFPEHYHQTPKRAKDGSLDRAFICSCRAVYVCVCVCLLL